MAASAVQRKPKQAHPHKDKVWTIHRIEAEADALLAFFEVDNGKIFLNDFTIERGYPPQYLSEWCKESKYFADAHARALAFQEQRVLDRGWMKANGYEPSITKLILAHHHKYRDSSDQPLQATQINITISPAPGANPAEIYEEK